MYLSRKIILVSLITLLVLSACASAVPAPAVTAEDMQKSKTSAAEETMNKDDMNGEQEDSPHDSDTTMDEKTDDMADPMKSEMTAVETPDWFNASLTNAQTGEQFTINELEGKVILLETLAMWCSNCLKQQKEVKALHELLGEREDFVSIGLDIDPYEEAQTLKEYAESNQFTWIYVVAGAEVSREIGLLYGDQFLNPPSTPMFIIDRNGEVHPLPFGIKSAEDLKDALEPFLEQNM